MLQKGPPTLLSQPNTSSHSLEFLDVQLMAPSHTKHHAEAALNNFVRGTQSRYIYFLLSCSTTQLQGRIAFFSDSSDAAYIVTLILCTLIVKC